MEQDSDFNSYASQQGPGLVDETSPEVIRRAHIKHEADIKAVGSLYAFFGVIMAQCSGRLDDSDSFSAAIGSA